MVADHTDPEWLYEQYVEMEKSTNQIANEVGENQGTIWYHLDKHGINTRDRMEEVKKSCRVPYANYHMTHDGHMRWKTTVSENKEKAIGVHRLLAIAEYGFDAVCGKEVHHKNRIPWDNRPENLEPLTQGDHKRAHSDQFDRWKNRDNPYRDEERLRELYIEKQMNQNEIAEEFGVAGSTIGNWLRKFDIPVRSIGEAKRLEAEKENGS